MKNKIENVNEVESKVNVKEELIELLNGCTIFFDDKYIDYRKDSELLFYYSKSKNHFYIDFNIWFNFKNKYNLDFQQMDNLLADILEEVLNFKGVTPMMLFNRVNR